MLPTRGTGYLSSSLDLPSPNFSYGRLTRAGNQRNPQELEEVAVNETIKDAFDSHITELTSDMKLLVEDVNAKIDEHLKVSFERAISSALPPNSTISQNKVPKFPRSIIIKEGLTMDTLVEGDGINFPKKGGTYLQHIVSLHWRSLRLLL